MEFGGYGGYEGYYNGNYHHHQQQQQPIQIQSQGVVGFYDNQPQVVNNEDKNHWGESTEDFYHQQQQQPQQPVDFPPVMDQQPTSSEFAVDSLSNLSRFVEEPKTPNKTKMIPVRIDKNSKVARTKAGMRKLAAEQRAAASIPAVVNKKKKAPAGVLKKPNGGPKLKVVAGAVEIDAVDKNFTRPSTAELVRSVEFDVGVPWECVFCRGGPDFFLLGDLFGPYFVEKKSPKGKKTQKTETWMHQDCAVWAGDVVLVGARLRGLDEAVLSASKSACAECFKLGASVSCAVSKCRARAHFPCARKSKWKLEISKFSAFCTKHSNK